MHFALMRLVREIKEIIILLSMACDLCLGGLGLLAGITLFIVFTVKDLQLLMPNIHLLCLVFILSVITYHLELLYHSLKLLDDTGKVIHFFINFEFLQANAQKLCKIDQRLLAYGQLP